MPIYLFLKTMINEIQIGVLKFNKISIIVI